MAEPEREVGEVGDDGAEPDSDCPWPAEHMLAAVWEECGQVRHQVRMTGKILGWPKKELTGIATLPALSYNQIAVTDAIKVWATTSGAKAPPLKWVKQEAGAFKMFSDENPAGAPAVCTTQRGDHQGESLC